MSKTNIVSVGLVFLFIGVAVGITIGFKVSFTSDPPFEVKVIYDEETGEKLFSFRGGDKVTFDEVIEFQREILKHMEPVNRGMEKSWKDPLNL